MGWLHRRGLRGAALLVAAAVILIGLTWLGTWGATEAEEREARARVAADVSNQALVFEDQLRRELLVLDQTLRILEHAWEADPGGFDLQGWKQRALALPDLTLQLFVTDANGIIRSSTRPELIGNDVSGRDYFRDRAGRASDGQTMFIGPSTRGLITHWWQMNMARRLDDKAGHFAGVIVISYDNGALTRFYRQVDLGEGGMIALVGLQDGRLRALVGPVVPEPGLDISRSAMFAAMAADPDGRWIGPSEPDGVERIHAFRQVPDRELDVVVAFDLGAAMAASVAFHNAALAFASGTTILIVIMTAGLLRARAIARRREAELDRDRRTLAAANAELDAARRRADAKSAQLEGTLTGMSDGVSMLDADLRLVAWNDLFPEMAGVPPELLQIGTPLAELVRAQAERGEFGRVDVEAEVTSRIRGFGSKWVAGTMERTRPSGRTIELRRIAMPGGGWVVLYKDITGRKLAEEAMRRTREMAEAATEAKTRFVATVSHEILTPLNTLLTSLRLLAGAEVSGMPGRLVQVARQAGEDLLGLMNDILEMSKLEAGRLTLRPSLFALRPLLESVADPFRDQAAARGISLSIVVEPGVAELIHHDAGRVRQILINLLSNAIKFADAGEVLVLAEQKGRGSRPELRLTVRDPGPALSAKDRAQLFHPFARLDRARTAAVPGTGLGLWICRSLAALMDAEMGCEAGPSGGNDFWLTVPMRATEETPAPERASEPGEIRVPRTRILLVEDVLPSQLVTALILRQAGHMVDVASSAAEAVERVARVPYDMVLMDVLMPGMDGLEATRRIRALSGLPRSVPVVALTANAGVADFSRYLSAGMNDLVAKPTQKPDLLAVIARHVWGRHPVQGGTGRPQERQPGRASVLVSPDRLSELRANLPPRTLAELAEGCLAELDERMRELGRELAAGNLQAIEYQAHAMMGLAAGYGLSSLDQQLGHVLASARAGRLVEARRGGAGLEDELDRAGPALRAALVAEPAEG